MLLGLGLAIERLNTVLEPISFPIAHALGLPRLPTYFGTILLSYVGFNVIERISPLVFERLFPEHFGKASERVRQGWSNRACSTVHAVYVVYLASIAITKPEILLDKVRGTHPAEGIMEAFSAGFIWDILEESFFHYQDPAFALHGVLVLIGITLTLRPLFPYTSVTFLFQEISTPFLNFHWFLDKTNRTGTKLQLINGIILISVFFFARICFGALATYRFHRSLFEVRSNSASAVSNPLFWTYYFGTIALQMLNWFWMYKMIAALRKRFRADSESEKTAPSKKRSKSD